ncbi:MAG: M14 family metallopeptidase [Dysgonamonadaceae bacterium]
MKEEILFQMKSPYRDEFKIKGYRFGEGEKTVAIVGALRGDEIQQQFICSQIVKNLLCLEEEGKLSPGCEILVIPCANHFSMNIEKRFWAMDNTDINRMFPGYDKGETTQRIASVIFEHVRHYKYGIQLASFYLPGDFCPHISIIETGYQNHKIAQKFGLPFILLRKPKSFDTTLLNYNWQIFGTDAFSIYAGETSTISKDKAKLAWVSVLRFLNNMHIINLPTHEGFHSYSVHDKDLIDIVSDTSGFMYQLKSTGDNVKRGDVIAKILNPFTGATNSIIKSPVTGIIFFSLNKPLIQQHSLMFKLVEF